MAIQVIKRKDDNVVTYVNSGTIVDASIDGHFTFSEAVSDWGISSEGWNSRDYAYETLADDFTFPDGFGAGTHTIIDGVISAV